MENSRLGYVLQELHSLGDLNSTEEEILLKLIQHAKHYDRFWKNKFDQSRNYNSNEF